jgi:hypothetical protein
MSTIEYKSRQCTLTHHHRGLANGTMNTMEVVVWEISQHDKTN